MFQMLFQLVLLLLGFQMPLAVAQKIKYACSEIHEKYKMYLRFFFIEIFGMRILQILKAGISHRNSIKNILGT